MKSLFSNTISESIQYDEVAGSSSKPFIKTQYYDDSLSTWVDFQDVKSRSISLSNENKRYMSFSFLPPSKEMTLVLDNANSVYSTGSGDAKASILKKNLKVRCYTGYELSATGSYSTADDFNGKKYHTWSTGGMLYASIGSYVGTISKYAFFNTYDRFMYGERDYAPSGYYSNKFTFSSTAYDSFDSIVISSNSNRISERHKVGDLGWSAWTQLASGTNTIAINSDADSKSLEYILRWDIPTWGNTAGVSAITINAKRKGYMFPRGIYLIDDPEYNDTVTIKGRDYLKKGLETEINLPTYSNTSLQSVVTNILDRCSIPYDTATWDATTGVVSVNASVAQDINNISGWKALDYLMDASNNGSDDWLLKWEDNGNLSLKKQATDVEADYVIDYRWNIENISKNFNSEKQLQRVTVSNKDIPTNPERLLKTITGTSLTQSATWASASLHLRLVDTNGGLSSETSRSGTGLTLNFTNTASHSVSIYGCPITTVKSWYAYGEKINTDNQSINDGSTFEIVNPFLSSTQCQALAEKLISLYADPQKKIELSMNSNPYLELIDNVMVFDLYTYSDDIYQVREIKEDFNEPVLKDSISLVSRGFSYTNTIWDRNGHESGVNDMNYDKGFVYDMDLRIGETDTRTYLKPTRSA